MVYSRVVFSPIFFKSGIGCQINNTYIVGVAYGDDIAISCPSLYGLNIRLDICNNFALDNFITFNKKKTVCIGELIQSKKYAKLDGKLLK